MYLTGSIVQDVKDINISKSSIIEASAGTGKTYLLERIYLRLLLETQTPVDRIVIVTYSKKAASEIKARIYKLIKKILDESNNSKQTGNLLEEIFKKPPLEKDILKLKQQTSQVRVYTIHSFFLYLLQKYYFTYNFPLHYSLQPFSLEYTSLVESAIQTVLTQIPQIEELWCTLPKKLEKVKESIVKLSNNPHVMNSMHSQYTKSSYIEEKNNNNFYFFLLQKVLEKFIVLKVEEQCKQHQYEFQDIVLNLNKILYNSQFDITPILREVNYLLIDEFQDTDLVQWSTFSKIINQPFKNAVVIGDPKQSIYGFRGGSFEVYNNAKEEMQKKDSILYILDKNYRSSSKIIEVLNILFQTKASSGEYIWFPEDLIKFTPSKVSQKNKDLTNVYHKVNKIFLPALYIISKQDATSLTNSKEKLSLIDKENYFLFITKEILELTQSCSILDIQRNQHRDITFSDIVILTRTNQEASEIQNLLYQKNIPAITFKQGNIFKSNEAKQIKAILSFLLHPTHKKNILPLIISDLIRFPIYSITNRKKESHKIIYTHLIQEWIKLMGKKKWNKLFHELEQTICFRLSQKEKSSIEKYQTIFKCLKEYTQKNIITPQELLLYYNTLEKKKEIESTSPPENNNKVKIYTIHKIKGLEFNIVFIAGGFNKQREKNKTDEDENFLQKFYTPLAHNEEKNIFYVALTRAKFLLYIPFYSKKKKCGSKGINVGPLGQFVHESLESMINRYPLPQTIEDNLYAIKVTETQQTQKCKKSIENLKKREGIPQKYYSQNLEHIDALHNKIIPILKNVRSIESYSSLSKTSQTDNSLSKPITETVIHHTNQKLASNSTTGNYLHYLLEVIDFKLFALSSIKDLLETPPLNKLIEKAIHLHPVELQNTNYELNNITREEEINIIKEETTRILYHTLTKKIETSKGAFHLCHTPSHFLIKEKNFLSQMKKIKEQNTLNNTSRTNIFNSFHLEQETYISGSIDLLIAVGNMIYIIDYKSNLLPQYNSTTLEEYSNQNYNIQKQIYSNVVQMWLQNLNASKLMQYQYGGFIFLYLRGLNTKEKGQEGVCYLAP